MACQIEITPTALEALEAITDRRTRSALVRRICWQPMWNINEPW